MYVWPTKRETTVRIILFRSCSVPRCLFLQATLAFAVRISSGSNCLRPRQSRTAYRSTAWAMYMWATWVASSEKPTITMKRFVRYKKIKNKKILPENPILFRSSSLPNGPWTFEWRRRCSWSRTSRTTRFHGNGKKTSTTTVARSKNRPPSTPETTTMCGTRRRE